MANFEAVKPRTLTDDDVEQYIKASEENINADDLKGAEKKEEKKLETKKEETPLTPEQKEALEKEIKEKQRTLGQLSEEDEKLLLESQGTENQELDENGEKIQKKVTKKDIQSAIGYKDMVSVMIEDGGWDKIITLEDGSKVDLSQVPEEEFTSEVYTNLVKYQNSLKAQEVLQEEKNKYGEDGLQLFKYLQEGGKLSEISQFYQAAKEIDGIDVTTVEGAAEMIQEYYERTGEDKDWIKDYVDTLKDKGEDAILKDGARKKTKLLEAVEAEKLETIASNAERAEQRKLSEQRYNTQVREAIYKDASLTEREKREYERYGFDYNHPHPQNPTSRVNQFYIDFQNIQNDPAKFFKLQKIVKDFDKYEDKTKVGNEEKKTIHTFLRKNQNSISKSTTQDLEFQNNKAPGVFDIEKFNKLIKNKI